MLRSIGNASESPWSLKRSTLGHLLDGRSFLLIRIQHCVHYCFQFIIHRLMDKCSFTDISLITIIAYYYSNKVSPRWRQNDMPASFRYFQGRIGSRWPDGSTFSTRGSISFIRVIGASLRPPTHWRRDCGRPCDTWLRMIDTDVQPVNIRIRSACRKASDRTLWPSFRRHGNTPPWGTPLNKKFHWCASVA